MIGDGAVCTDFGYEKNAFVPRHIGMLPSHISKLFAVFAKARGREKVVATSEHHRLCQLAARHSCFLLTSFGPVWHGNRSQIIYGLAGETLQTGRISQIDAGMIFHNGNQAALPGVENQVGKTHALCPGYRLKVSLFATSSNLIDLLVGHADSEDSVFTLVKTNCISTTAIFMHQGAHTERGGVDIGDSAISPAPDKHLSTAFLGAPLKPVKGFAVCPVQRLA
ncbi:MAG: hypothetical protein BWY75_03265 [bacterium ADurb.Bin425]|nr:MAG: hypothetical protein BWY75_03265 [bacterium ADurb.Bin425]